MRIPSSTVSIIKKQQQEKKDKNKIEIFERLFPHKNVHSKQ